MRPYSSVATALAVAALVFATACDDDSTSPNKNDLTPAEARTVAAAVFGEIVRAIGSASPASASTAASLSVAARPATVTASVQARCSAGGSISGEWTFNDDTNASGTGTKSGSVTLAASNCNISTGERTLTTNGSYTFTFAASFTNNALSSDFVWNGTGNFEWTGGSCALDYTIRVAPQGRRTLSGTVCGVDVQGTVE